MKENKKCRWEVKLFNNSPKFSVMLEKVFSKARADKMKLVDFQDEYPEYISWGRIRANLVSKMTFEKDAR